MSPPFVLLSSAILPLAAFLAFASATPVKENETASIEQFNVIAQHLLEGLDKIQDSQKRFLEANDKTPQLPGFFTKTRKRIGAFLLAKIGVATTSSDDGKWEEYVKKEVEESINNGEEIKKSVEKFIEIYPALDQGAKDYLYKELIKLKQKQEIMLKRIEYGDQITEALNILKN